MDPFIASFAGGLAISAVGMFMQNDASNKLAEAQKSIFGIQQQQENIRERAMELDARRRQREVIRQGIIAKSQALATTTNQGAQFGSGLQGAYGQIQGQENWSLSGINSSLGFGREMFASNRNILDFRKQEADYNTESSTASGLTSLGGKISGSAGHFQNVFGTQ